MDLEELVRDKLIKRECTIGVIFNQMGKDMKFNLIILLAFSFINHNISAIGTKGLAFAAAGTGFVTKLALEKYVDDTSAIGAGVLAGTAIGAALIRRDCNKYKKLMKNARNILEYARNHELIKELTIYNGLKNNPDYARLVFDSELRSLYPNKYAFNGCLYTQAKFDLRNLNQDLQDGINDAHKASDILHDSPLLTPLKGYFIGTQNNNHLSNELFENLLDVKFKQELVREHFLDIEREKLNKFWASKGIVE